MKIKILLMAFLILPFILPSCGRKNNKKNVNTDQTVELHPYKTTVKGYLSGVLEIVDGTYKFELKREIAAKGIMQIKLKSIGKGSSKDYGLRDGNDGPLYLTLCDANGTPLTDFSDIASSYSADGLLKSMVSKVGEENWIKFDEFIYGKETIPDEASTFIITSKKIEENKNNKEASSSSYDSFDDDISSNSDIHSNSGDAKWDKVLDDYEKYVDQYLKFLIKASKGDMRALSEYPSLLQKAEKLENSLSKADNEKSLSITQIHRMNEIHMKMLDVALKMEKEESTPSNKKKKNKSKKNDDDSDDEDDF